MTARGPILLKPGQVVKIFSSNFFTNTHLILCNRIWSALQQPKLLQMRTSNLLNLRKETVILNMSTHLASLSRHIRNIHRSKIYFRSLKHTKHNLKSQIGLLHARVQNQPCPLNVGWCKWVYTMVATPSGWWHTVVFPLWGQKLYPTDPHNGSGGVQGMLAEQRAIPHGKTVGHESHTYN